MERPNPKELEYAFCDDWLIYARDKQGKLWYVVTEVWQEWLDVGIEKAWEENAVEKYMLPIAKQKWNKLFWRYAEYSN